MSEADIESIIAAIAPAIPAIELEAARRAALRSAEVARVSGGAVEITPDQLLAIHAKAAEEMFNTLREQLHDVANVFALTITSTE